MTQQSAWWPQKAHNLHNHHMDSTVWDDFRFRDDDIVISTYAKSGTTWMQQIVSQLVFSGAEGLKVSDMSPWVDLRVPPREVKLPALEAQDHRRFVKTHLPVDALVFSRRAKYVYIARDGRDVAFSLYNHYAKANAKFYEILNDTPGRVGPPIAPAPDSVRDFFRDWLERDGFPFWSFWDNVRTWWEARQLPNVLFVHFADLKADLPGQIRRIAAFLEIPIDPVLYPTIVEHCSFDYMKRHADETAPLGGAVWEGGASTFINKGTNGRWRDVLTAEESRAYEARALRELGPECAHWLATGERAAAGSRRLAA